MKTPILTLIAIGWTLQARAAACEAELWESPKFETKILEKHPQIAHRDGDRLTIVLENGKKSEFRNIPDRQISSHLYAVGPHEEWVAILEKADGGGPTTRLVHRKSGKTEKIAGCPDWSPNGKTFVSLSEDGVNGATTNEARIWQCADPAESCRKIWSSKKGGHGVTWSGGKVEVVLRQTKPNGEEEFQRVHCAPTDKGAYCETRLPELPKKKQK